MQRFPFALDEWYHCYSRGIDRRRTFVNKKDYERFLSLLYICNSIKSPHRSDLGHLSLPHLLSRERATPLVAIGAYCLMPNHFHLLLKEVTDGGISTFMQKLGTAYTMYFNIKYERNGGLFVKPFRSRHIADDRYLQYLLQYIHCNPAELFEPGWKSGNVRNAKILHDKLLEYPYSSFKSHQDHNYFLRKLLDDAIFNIETQCDPKKILEEALQYYQDVKASP